MSVNKISPVYNYNGKTNGQTLDATEWNSLSQATHDTVVKVNEVIDNLGNGGGTVIDSSGKISVSNKGNLTIGNNSIKNINLEPGYPYSLDNTKYGDIALKPGDDILFVSHHREAKKRDKIVLKSIDGSDNPVKTQIVTGELEIALGTEDNPKTATRQKDSTTGADISETPLFKTEDSKTLDIRIITGLILDKNTNNKRDERANLKVRAKAIDLRCEDHGGIALQPKGEDSDHHMNKIKFEHGGGDGLEFGTFNAEKTSIFTDEYRFNKDGVWKMATRTKVARANDDSKRDASDSTTHYTYVKADDDFYDNILPIDSVATTEQIINTANALNGSGVRSTNQTNLLRIKTEECFTVIHNANLYNIYYTSEAPSGFSGFQTYAVRNLTTELITSISRIENQTSIKEFLNVPESISNTVLNTDIVSIGNKLLIELYGEQSENPDGYFVVKLVSSIPSENVFSITGTYDAENDNGNLDSIVDLKSAFVDGKEYTFEELTKDFTIALQKAYYQLTGRTSYNTNLTSFQTDFAEALTNTFSTTKLILIHGAGNRNLVYIARFGYDEGAKDIWIEGGDEVKLESTRLVRMTAPNSIALSSGNVINITSEGNLTLQSNSGKVNINGKLDFGDTFNFGETEDGIQTQRKLTKGGNTKPCDTIKVVGVNNHTSNNLTVDGWDSQNNAITTYTIAPGNTQTLAECSLLDVILLTNYMKTHQEGPWAAQL